MRSRPPRAGPAALISRSRKRRESQEKEGEMPCTELGGEAPGHILTTLRPGWEEARRCHSPGGRRDKLGRGPGEEPGPRVRGQESGSSATQQPVVPCPHSTSPPQYRQTNPQPQAAKQGEMPAAPCGESRSQIRAGARGGCGRKDRCNHGSQHHPLCCRLGPSIGHYCPEEGRETSRE